MHSLSLRSHQPQRQSAEIDHCHAAGEQQQVEHPDTDHEDRHRAQRWKGSGIPEGPFFGEGSPAV